MVKSFGNQRATVYPSWIHLWEPKRN
jgi:hypothetical protein